MGFLGKKSSGQEPEIAVAVPDAAFDEKGAGPEQSSEEDFGTAKQAGVRKVEAAAQAWSKWDLATAYGLLVSILRLFFCFILRPSHVI